jgi:HipA-like protein
VADRLVAWLYDTPVAVLSPAPEFRISLEWRAEGIERWGLGQAVFSVAIPIGSPTGPRDMRGLDFFENMLPEGPALIRMAALAGVRPVDTYGILQAFGRDCAGATMVLPDGERPGVRNFGDPRDVTNLLRRTAFNMAVGNADAHAKNFSVLHDPDSPAISLVPLYDVLSTIALEITVSVGEQVRGDAHLGQRVGGQTDVRKVTAANLIDEASTWGIRRRAAAAVVTETLDRVLSSIPAAQGDEQVLAVIREQATRVIRG